MVFFAAGFVAVFYAFLFRCALINRLLPIVTGSKEEDKKLNSKGNFLLSILTVYINNQGGYKFGLIIRYFYTQRP